MGWSTPARNNQWAKFYSNSIRGNLKGLPNPKVLINMLRTPANLSFESHYDIKRKRANFFSLALLFSGERG